MEWLNERYPKATKLDDYGMYGREFPPEVIEYVHAHWTRVDNVYTKPDVIVKANHTIVITPLRDDIRLTVPPEAAQAEEATQAEEAVQAVSQPQPLDAANKEALKVLVEKGPDKAADFMMSMAGGDYARMRSMYG